MAGVIGREIVSVPTRKNRYSCPLYTVGVDRCKDLIFWRLNLERPGPGYMHFPTRYDQEFFEQLTAEERRDKYVQGRKTSYYHQVRKRNEALDLSVYNTAAITLLNPDFTALTTTQEEPEKPVRHPLQPVQRRTNFATGWKK